MQPTASSKLFEKSPPALLLLVWCCLGGEPAFAAEAKADSLIGKFVTVVSDEPLADERTGFVRTFDAAVPLWAERLGIDPQRLSDFHVTAHVFASRERMLQAGVLPAEVPVFSNGIQVGDSVWLVRGKSDYATTHLLLHEGVHALMHWAFQGVGAGWFSEGVAELLATHAWREDRLHLGIVPDSRETFSHWGRIGVMNQERASGRVPAVERILAYKSSATADLSPYAWSWALLVMLDAYPEYRKVWVASLADVKEVPEVFNQRFKQRIGSSWNEMCQRWRVWSAELDYGFDVQRNRLPLISQSSTSGTEKVVKVSASPGWQPVRMGLPKDTKLQIKAEGDVILDRQPKPWRSEAPGITLAYHAGRPVGELQALALDAPASQDGWCRPLHIHPIGHQNTVTLAGGVLLLRVNDFPGKRQDNEGAYQVQVTFLPE